MHAHFAYVIEFGSSAYAIDSDVLGVASGDVLWLGWVRMLDYAIILSRETCCRGNDYPFKEV